jgi:flavin-dependent dehydrogenase
MDDPDADSDHRTIIEATPDGWFYSALLPPKDSSSIRVVAFHTLPSHPSAKYARRRDGFLDNLHASSTHVSSIIKDKDYQMDPVGGFPRCTAAGSSFLDKPCDVQNRWIAVGDAAMAFDPLSSQGMMTALEMACHVGLVLAKLLDGEDAKPRIEESYCEVREAYETRRAYYYGIVKRFDGSEFWTKVVRSNATV